MDQILNGILKSNKELKVKQAMVIKVKDAASKPQTLKSVSEMIQLTMKLMLHETDPFIKKAAREVYVAWANQNRAYITDIFTVKTVHSIMEEQFNVGENVPWLLEETFKIIAAYHTSVLSEYTRIVEMRAIDFLRKNPQFKTVHAFSSLLLKFKECIPKNQFRVTFCNTLLSTIGNFDEFDRVDVQPFEIIKHVNKDIANLLEFIWTQSVDVVNESLHHVFRILTNDRSETTKSPAICLAGAIRLLPKGYIQPSVKYLVNDPSVSDASIGLALKRMIGWFGWPGSDVVIEWVKTFFIELNLKGKHILVNTIIENHIEIVAGLLDYSVVRNSNFAILKYMLLTYQESPDPWLKIAGGLTEKIKFIREDLKNPALIANTHEFLGQLAELIYCMVQLHPGFPDIYEPLLNAIRDQPRPRPDIIDSMLTSHRTQRAPQTPQDRRRSSIHVQGWLKKSSTGKIGLANLGNTCYMNSVLQALYMCDRFRQDVLESKPTKHQPLLVKLQYVFAFLTASHRPFFYPEAFYEASLPSWFQRGYQQDCSEFLRYLLDQLDDQELAHIRDSMKKSGSANAIKSDKKEKGFHLFKSKTKESKSSSDNLQISTESQMSLVSHTFGGKLLNTYHCLKCNTQSHRIERFCDIALAFPESLKNEPIRQSQRQRDKHQQQLIGGSALSGHHGTNLHANHVQEQLTLTDMLSNYLAPEKLIGDNKYKCDKCKSLQDAERRIHITQAPEYLILTLLRFSFDYKTQRRSKIFTDVKYPKTLLVPVVDSPPSPSSPEIPSGEKKKSRRKSPNGSAEENGSALSGASSNMSTKAVTYALCGVVVHSGLTSDAGHYYCYARHSIPVDEPTISKPGEMPDYLQDKWHLFNDARVTFSGYESFSEVTQKFTKDTAYVLFYRKIGTNMETVHSNSTILPQIVDPPLRMDLLNAVDKDNARFMQEQEVEARRREMERASGFSLWGWKDGHDRGPPPPSCGGGGGGGMGFNSPHFVF